MQGFANGCSIRETLNPQGLKQFGDSSKDVLEEVELGGLEDDGKELPTVEYNEEEFLYVKEEGVVLRSLSDIDDLACIFSKLINNVSGLNGTGVIGDRGSRESSSVVECAQEYPNCLDQQFFNIDSTFESKQLFS